jgi:hypothetical protein
MNEFTLSKAYATGTVSADVSRGLFGELNSSTISQTHWVPSQSTVDEPSPLQEGEVPYTEFESKDFIYYNYDDWSMDPEWAENLTWTICEAVNDGYPFITAFFAEEPCLAAQTLTPTPTISGTGVEGEVLTANPGTWDDGTQLRYSWFVAGVIIPTATGTTFTPRASDVGRTVTFQVISTKEGYEVVVKFSLGVVITAQPVAPVTNNLSITMGGFAANSWYVPAGFWKKIKAGVKAHKNATTITCVGIVGSHPSKAWQKTLGLNRAALACATAKFFNPKLKTKLTWKIASPSDQVKRGATIRFNR